MESPLLKTWVLLCCMLCLSITAFSQYPYYFTSGNFNPPGSWSQANAARMGTVANTNIQTAPATAVGSVYFSFYSATSAGTHFAPSGTADSLIPLNTPFPLMLDGGHGKSFYFVTQNLTDNYIFKTTGSGAPGNTYGAAIRVQGPIQSVASLARYPAGNIDEGQPVQIQVTLTDTFSPGQGAYLRFTTDNWSTSTVISMSGQGTLYTATIPGNYNTSGTALNYYVFTSASNQTIVGTDADLMTINLYNNNFANFTYTVQCPFITGNAQLTLTTTDKARYNPGDTVKLHTTFSNTIGTGSLQISYWHLGDSIAAEVLPLSNAGSCNFSWQPPLKDYQGYMVQLHLLQNNVVVDSASIAIDVSSNWKKFPRYGFLSAYPYTTDSDRQQLFTLLNRYHLNGLQFYDVNYKHNIPLAGTLGQPDTLWNDIANRPTYLSTVLPYIDLAHACNIMAMNYNLLYGAYQNSAIADGVLPQWGIYSDQNHQNPITYTLPATWASNLQVENSADTGWQNYLFANEKRLFQTLPFDGWHVDQLGSQGIVYDYNGQQVDLAASFGTYLQHAYTKLGLPLVMNAVTNYGQQQISTAPVEFLYTEVWPPYTTYNDLVTLIHNNNQYGGNNLATVLAAYMNRGISGSPGIFNAAAVLLTDATIFAAGGSHIEMGEHLLGNEYFPNENLSMSCDLQQNLVRYYDFMTAYENLLRDSVSSSPVTIQSTGNVSLSNTAATGSIWTISTQKTNTQIFQLINLANANTLNWNDPNDNQTTPNTLQNTPLQFTSAQPVKRIYCLSPDWNNGLAEEINYTQTGNAVAFNLSALKYWSMVVVEYGQIINSVANVDVLEDIVAYPNPFYEELNFNLTSRQPMSLNLQITDALGQVIFEKNKLSVKAGSQLLQIPLNNEATGLYFWSITGLDNAGNIISRRNGKLMHGR